MINNDITLNSEILVVDDSLTVLKVIQQILESNKYKVRTAQSAGAAYMMLGSFLPDLILLDLAMPKVNGYEILNKIKTTPEWQHIPVIFITGADDRRKEEHALAMGAVDYILKPIVKGVLLKRIKFQLELNLYQKKLEEAVFIRTEELLKTQEELCRTAEIANESLRVKSAFLANMSHEIRTPLNSVIGFSELALSESAFVPAKVKDYLKNIKLGAEGLLDVINDVLDISKIESGKLTLESIPFDIIEVFKSCQTLIQLKADEQGIRLFCYAEPTIGKKIMGDPTKLRQVLLNLLANAVKFTNQGTVKMTASTVAMTQNTATIHFEIKDSGIGIQPEQLERLFQPFEQANNSMTRKYGGTGLGLPITKNIIELMGGELEVESTPDVGSKFSFDLTFDTISDSLFNSQNVHDINFIEKPVFKGDVLICEDNLMNQQVISEHLKRVGLNICIAYDGNEGVELVQRRADEKKEPFDLIFMDIHMPVMDGIEAASRLAKMGSKSPVVALTANITNDSKALFRQAGITDYIAKPFTMKELWNCLSRHLVQIEIQTVNKDKMSDADKKLQEKLMMNFRQENQTSMKDISDALAAGDIKSARGKAHTLKSAALLINRYELAKAADTAERMLANGENNTTEELLASLEFELNAVLTDLNLKFKKITCENDKNNNYYYENDKSDKKNVPVLSERETFKLLESIELKIKEHDLDCLDYIEVLCKIPGSDILITQIEEFEFDLAYETLSCMKQKLEADINE